MVLAAMTLRAHTNRPFNDWPSFEWYIKVHLYFTENIFPLHYKEHALKAVQGGYLYLLWNTYETHQYILWHTAESLIVTAGVTYLNHQNLNGCVVALYAKLFIYSNHRALNGVALHVPLQTTGQCAYGSVL